MARRITDITKDLSIVNKEFNRIDAHEARLTALEAQIGILNLHTQQIRDTRQVVSLNNLVFTWTGSTTTLSWDAGYVQDSSLRNYPVPAGSKVLGASGTFWLAWNPKQGQMATATTLATLVSGGITSSIVTQNAAGNNLIICSVLTGTSGQSGVAGGGGSDPGGSGPCGKQYVTTY